MADRRHRQRWTERRAKGLCGDCGQVPSERYSRCTLCRQFVNEYRKRWLRRGAASRINKTRRARYQVDAAFREQARARARQFWADNHEAGKARNRAYYLAHREVLIAKQRERDARRKAMTKAA